MLSIKDLTIEYSSGGYVVRPISNLSLEAGEGQLVLLLGASGCGKTTLLSVIAGLLTPASGSVTVVDTEVVGLSGNALTEYRRHTVGVVFQAFNLLPALTASENVRCRCARPVGARRRRASGPTSCSPASTSRSGRITFPATCPAVSSNACAIARGSRTTRRCSSPTSRPRTSTTSRSRA